MTAAARSESLALEKPDALFPFLDYITSTATPNDGTPAGNTDQLHFSQNGDRPSPANTDWSTLSPSQVHSTLQHHLLASGLLSPSALAALNLSIAAREGSVAIESFRQLWLERERAVQRRPGAGAGDGGCESWVDLGGWKVCSAEELWELVGQEQQDAMEPLVVPER